MYASTKFVLARALRSGFQVEEIDLDQFIEWFLKQFYGFWSRSRAAGNHKTHDVMFNSCN